MILFDKEYKEKKIEKYNKPTETGITLVFTDKEIIDWDNLFKLIQLNNTGYITS